jgi:hypothetical protein
MTATLPSSFPTASPFVVLSCVFVIRNHHADAAPL